MVPDFKLLDVWALPTPGRRDEFPRLVHGMTSFDPKHISSSSVRLLFDIRRKLGEWFRLDEPQVGGDAETLRDRLPADLREVPPEVAFDELPASVLYVTDDEFAAEVSNKTVHGVIHLGWVGDDRGGYRGQLAILIKPNGLFGTSYVAAIAPFRHLLVYPTLIREIGSRWQEGTTGSQERA